MFYLIIIDKYWALCWGFRFNQWKLILLGIGPIRDRLSRACTWGCMINQNELGLGTRGLGQGLGLGKKWRFQNKMQYATCYTSCNCTRFKEGVASWWLPGLVSLKSNCPHPLSLYNLPGRCRILHPKMMRGAPKPSPTPPIVRPPHGSLA